MPLLRRLSSYDPRVNYDAPPVPFEQETHQQPVDISSAQPDVDRPSDAPVVDSDGMEDLDTALQEGK